MSKTTKLATTVRSFAKDEGGNFALVFAAASAVLMMSAGLAVDYTRLISAKSQLHSALDSALLSTAKDIAKGKITKSAAEKRVNDFFVANLSALRFPSGNAKVVNFAFDPTNSVLSAGAVSDVKMMFPVFGTAPHQRVAIKGAANFAERLVEVSMVLDVTGSMNDPVKSTGSRKIDDLKSAAKVAVKAFLDNGSDNARVAIVPYSNAVNAGALSFAVQDPTGNKPMDSCATERRGPTMYDDTGPSSKVTRAKELAYNDCPVAALQPLTKDMNVLNKMIDKLAPNGRTAGHMGIQWGQYLISPNWRSALPTSSDPVDYNTPMTEKYLILMTDGLFNIDAYDAFSPAPVIGIKERSGLMAMGYCDSLKANKVKVYTIGFDLDGILDKGQRDEAQLTLQSCASDSAKFFRANNRKDLENAFRKIAAEAQVVRLTN